MGHVTGLIVARTLLIATLVAPATAVAQPAILAGSELGNRVIDVSKPAASPVISLNVGGQAEEASFVYQGPSGEFFGQSFFSYNLFPGTVKLQGYIPTLSTSIGYQNSFSTFAEPGTWTLISASICSYTGFNCAFYQGAQLQALFSARTIKIINFNAFDITPPTLRNGDIVTKTLSRSEYSTLEIDIEGRDDLSGTTAAEVTACNGAYCPSTTSVATPLRPGSKETLQTLAPIPANAPLGTYSVYSVQLTDLANNTITINDPTQIRKVFHGQDKFTVTP